MHWLVYPLTYVATAMFAYLDKDTILKTVPNFIIPNGTITVSSYKPQLPSTPRDIIKTYKLYEQYDTNPAGVMSELTQIFKYNFTSKEEICEVMRELETAGETKTGSLSKFWRFVNLTNFVWLVSIIGIVVTFFPAFTFVFKFFGPLIILMTEILTFLIKFREEIGYTSLSFFLIQSLHCHKDIGFFFAFTTLVAYCGLFLHSASIHGDKNTSKEVSNMFVHTMMVLPTFFLTFV